MTFWRTVSMKSSSMPTFAKWPPAAPAAAPMAKPSSGTKKIRPNRRPQKAPPTPPATVMSESCRVFGFFLPSGHETTAASCTVMSACFWSSPRRVSTLSAPSGSSNFHTVRLAMSISVVWVAGGPPGQPSRASRTASSGPRHPDRQSLESPVVARFAPASPAPRVAPMGETPPPDDEDSGHARTALERIKAVKAAAHQRAGEAQLWVEKTRGRSPLVARGFDIADRDRARLGGLLAGAVAYRFFLWLLPFGLMLVGLLGAVTDLDPEAVDGASEAVGLQGVLTGVLQDGARQSGWWYAIAIGLFGTLYAGIGAVRALRVTHAAAWAVPAERMRSPLKASGALVGIAFGLLGIAWLVGFLREHSGIGGLVATLLMVAVYFVLWLRISVRLPRRDVSVRALVPGALIVAVGLECLHLFTVYYLADRAARAASVYGTIGAALTLLLWLFIVARLMVAAAVTNAELSARGERAAA